MESTPNFYLSNLIAKLIEPSLKKKNHNFVFISWQVPQIFSYQTKNRKCLEIWPKYAVQQCTDHRQTLFKKICFVLRRLQNEYIYEKFNISFLPILYVRK